MAAIGCLVERYREELAVELPEVDLWCGLETGELLRALEGLGTSQTAAARPTGKLRPVSRYLKISDGCSRRCSYCAIPLIKGDYRAARAEEVLSAARAALAAGARELILVGQDTSHWQHEGWGGLQRLLGELKALEPAPLWLRLLYLQPDGVSDDVLEALARSAVPYIDLPLQHASPPVLRRMRRRGGAEDYLRLLERVRSVLPGAAVRSTFMTGFPGETDADFEELLAFVHEAGFAAAGVFLFDPQEGTLAANLPDQVPEALAAERAAQLGEAVEEAASPFWTAMIGRRVEVLVERGVRKAGGEAVGRCALQAPDIDGRTFVRGAKLRRGDVVTAVIRDNLGYDLKAVVQESGA